MPIKFSYLFIALATITCATALSGCLNDDIGNKEPEETEKGVIEPTENPFEEDFKAPDGFDWSMLTTLNLNVEVKDEFNGQYSYLVEVFTVNPLSDATANPLASGYAKKGKNYAASLTLSKNIKRIYIQQTDPKQRKEVREFEVPGNGVMNCKLYYTEVQTRAAQSNNSASEAAKEAGITEPTEPNYTGTIEVPMQSDSPRETWNDGSGMKFAAGAKYIIEGDFKDKDIQVESGRMSIYVKGTWTLANTYTDFDIYVLNGGKIISDGSLALGNGATLTIAAGGSVEVKETFSCQCSDTKNFGTIEAKEFTNGGNAGKFYNKGTMNIPDKITLNSSEFFNLTALSTKELNLTDGTFVNKAPLAISGNIPMNGGTLFNHSTITFNTENGSLTSNSGTGTRIVNYANATIKGYEIKNGLAMYNDGTIEVSNFDSQNSGDLLYNSCTMIVKDKFYFGEITLNHGSITGASDETTWKPTTEVTFADNGHVNLLNGSIIKATVLKFSSGINVTASGSEQSMIKANTITFTNWSNTLNGNLIVEAETYTNTDRCTTNNVALGSYNGTQYTVETCGGIISEGNPGTPETGTPSYPIYPESGATPYTYAFENLWPSYGDYDMNDVVLTVRKLNITDHKERVSLQGEIKAIGAGKKIGVGIRFLHVLNSDIKGITDKNSNALTVESGHDNPVVIITNDAHQYCGNKAGDYSFVNTVLGKTKEAPGYEIEIEANSPEIADRIADVKNWDVFIISEEASGSTNRTEIHLAGYAPTALGDQSKFGQGNDASKSKGYYVSNENLAWGICIPGDGRSGKNHYWLWPQEYKKVSDVYPDFKGWVTSGGENNNDWTDKYDEKLIFPRQN